MNYIEFAVYLSLIAELFGWPSIVLIISGIKKCTFQIDHLLNEYYGETAPSNTLIGALYLKQIFTFKSGNFAQLKKKLRRFDSFRRKLKYWF